MPAKSSPSPTSTPSGGNETIERSWRDAFVDACAILAIAVVGITELLSRFEALTRTGIVIAWGIVAFVLGGWFLRKGTRPALIARAQIPELSREDKFYVAFIAFICLVCLYLAIASPPNAPDAGSYHVPRVLRWIQEARASFYPTHIARQLWIGPGWEYFATHLQLGAGMFPVTNLVQWMALAATPVVVSLIARELGAARRGQLLSALFTISIPMGIVQASGSQVDLFVGFWVAVSIATLLRIRRVGMENSGIGSALVLGGAVGMATLSKATSALFLLPFVLWIGLALAKRRPGRFVSLGAVAVVIALAMNVPHMLRNQSIYGSPLGVRGSSDVTNELFTPAAIASNVVRNAALHLGTPWASANKVLTNGIIALHNLAGIDPSDARTTFQRWGFSVPENWDDEGMGSNQLHFLLIIAVTAWLTFRKRSSQATRYLWCVLGGALLFSIFLKWQPWHSRLHLPLFIIAGAAIGASLESVVTSRRLRWIAIALALTAMHPAFRNNMRPLLVRRPMFTIPYEERLFTDPRGPSNAWGVYGRAGDFLAARGCDKVGIIIDPMGWEYPLWKIMERRTGRTPEIRHVAVTNPSRLAASERERNFAPCAIMTIHYFVPKAREELVMSQFFPDGRPQVPGAYTPAWNKEFITIYLPATGK